MRYQGLTVNDKILADMYVGLRGIKNKVHIIFFILFYSYPLYLAENTDKILYINVNATRSPYFLNSSQCLKHKKNSQQLNIIYTIPFIIRQKILGNH